MSTHDPFANAGGERRWTKEDDEVATSMKAKGRSTAVIAHALRRTSVAVRSRMRYLSLTDEQRTREWRAKEARRDAVVPTRIAHIHERAPTIPPEVIEERNQRYLAARSLTAILMGDPPRGYSALERRA